ncbi:DUF1206 domain-containing protein [Sanguibacter suaedae]|uniref:DUF1206 domain-containing protein n=1 Tax=Sanguibacter suaedae TaxID=2795737 RepID=A0A934MAK4_9MICO|nr:DUF1206 domain-containing protein [Sanguibacter suaedae]MBI9114326.1 DUF1206 domain-containing protein [Sanguibacter suaedae]
MNRSSASSSASSLGDSKALRVVARGGYAVSGVLHIVVGWIAMNIALGGSSGEDADQTGALAQIAETSWGPAFLWFAVVALVALALWQVTEAIAGGTDPDPSKRTMARVKAAAKAVAYGAIAVIAWNIVTGSASGSGETLTRTLMESTVGRVLVAAVGVGILAVGGYHVYKGVTKKFEEDLAGGTGGDLGKGVVAAGVAGYVGKGAALGVVGVLFVVGALQSDPEKATGLDVALRSLADLPYGKVLLGLVAVGLAAYGVYSFARARYAKM